MNVAIRDTSALRAIGAGELSAYLRSHGWTEEEIIGDRAAIWLKRIGTEEFEVMVPQKLSLDDYALRMLQAMETLSVVEERSELEIYADIQNTQTDTVRLRFISSVYESGTVPLSDAVRMLEGTRELALAAACAAVSPRAVYAKRKPQEAMDFLKKIRMGQTEQGSFVLSLHAAVPPRLRAEEAGQTVLPIENQALFYDAEREEPFERRATLTLARSLNAALHATRRAQSKGDFAPFREAVGQGVNANLCDALADLGLETPTQTLVIGFQWSPTRELLSPIPRVVELQTDQFTVLREAARQFRSSEPLEEYEVFGYVVRLDRNEGELEGIVTLSDYSEGKPRRVRILLSDADYQQALKANGDTLLVRCVGELVREGRSYTLKNPHGFALAE